MEDNPFPTPSLEKKPASKKKKRFIFLFFAIVFILLLIYVGSKVLNSNKSSKDADITPTPTEEFIIPTDTPVPTEELTPTPTQKPTAAPTPKSSTSSIDKTTKLDRKDLSVTVQNGSGEKGVAGKVADVLKGFGYNVTSTANADNFNYSDVTIQVKSAKSDYLPVLKKDLSSDYTIGSATSDLPSSSSADAVVIVGK